LRLAIVPFSALAAEERWGKHSGNVTLGGTVSPNTTATIEFPDDPQTVSAGIHHFEFHESH